MPTGSMGEVIRQLRDPALLHDAAGRTDAQLLEAFLARRDEAALAALVVRHAPMVWGVCRRVLRNEADAEDAFQAAFLVLVRRAASVASRGLLANWLYGVAHRTSLKARSTAARRRARETQVTEMPEPAAPPDPPHELRSLLDRELGRLPAKYRAPVVLCDLEGKTRPEAARELGWPEGTVAGWFARARQMLARRLARHGVLPAAGSLAAALAQEAASSAPPAVVASAVRAAALLATGQAARGAIPTHVLALTEGVTRAMTLSKLKAAAVLLAVVVLGTGLASAGLRHLAPADPPPAAGADDKKDARKPLDAIQGEWRITKLDVEFDEARETFEGAGKVVIKGDKARLVLDVRDIADKGEKVEEVWIADFTILKVDPGQSPAAIDLRIDKRTPVWSPKDDPEASKPKTAPGIYSLEGDTLKLFLGEDARPKAFPDKPRQGVVTLTRVKPQKGKDNPPPPPPPGGAKPEPAGPARPFGKLGVDLGEYVTVEGVRLDEGAFVGTQTLLVDTIGGKKLDRPIPIRVQNLQLPSKKRCVFKGYESGQMIGVPPAVYEAAKELGKEVGAVQAAWQWQPHFVVLIVVEPKGLELPEDKE